jgi:hypothetical protein
MKKAIKGLLVLGVFALGVFNLQINEVADPTTGVMKTQFGVATAKAGWYDCLGWGRPCSSESLANQTQKL